MAASAKGLELSKAEYLKRYLSADEDGKKSKGKPKKKRRPVSDKRLTIVDDDIDWKQMINEEEDEEDEEEAPVIAEMIDERPADVKQLEAFRTSHRWKVIGADENEDTEEVEGGDNQQQESEAPSRSRHDSPEYPLKEEVAMTPQTCPLKEEVVMTPQTCPLKEEVVMTPQTCHLLGSPRNRGRQKVKIHQVKNAHLILSNQHWEKDLRIGTIQTLTSHLQEKSCLREKMQTRTNPLQGGKTKQNGALIRTSRHPEGDRGVPRMLSGGTSGLVSIDVLRKEKEENRRRDRNNLPLEDQSRNAQTVFRDKTGKRRDLDTEREEKLKKAGEKAAKDEKYAQWGRGMAQGQMYQQKLEDAMHEAHKPLARQRDDEDLDRMLRDKQREGDPMAAMLRKKKDRSSNTHDKPRYKGPPPPPNRFDLLPGYRWDGCDRSNGFEQKRYTRIADKKAVQDAAYKWSVEDM
ncbi:hypothetical protein F7725_006682 [Dissostichus mawsoni]|uniref:BUD13 homolog n=1 Tax=Dissostichus mawsoni TaxID=36200 RepID=A0A7J5XUL4_DISMA|nr:hypothetical protein F7725_006682 [Dissostichus mawsoni]